MTETEQETYTVPRIEITFDPQGLIGEGTTWDAAGLDEQASTERYEEILTDVLQKEFPGAEILIFWRPVYATAMMIDTEPAWNLVDTPESYAAFTKIQARVIRRYAEVFEGLHGDWAVPANKA